MTGPKRIVCLTEETTELFYLLGEQDRIVGITVYTVRPQQAKRDKPIVSAFTGGSIPTIRKLRPDLVIGFSDVQAEYARALIAEGLPVLILNQRSIAEILETMQLLGNMVGAVDATRRLVDGWQSGLDQARERAARRGVRPGVYFEEWDDPMLTCIRWVSELVTCVGGQNVFEEASHSAASAGRVVTVDQVLEADPDIMLASWCGKPFDLEAAKARLGEGFRPFRDGHVHEVASELILQPGPAALTDGLRALEDAMEAWVLSELRD